MATQWISAAQALALVSDDHNEYMTQRALCARAHHGLLKAKAQRFVLDKETADDVRIPTRFWWAEGEAALDQDWKLGDFGTWIDQRQQMKAFGVRFDLDGLLAMLPSDRHGEIKRSLSVASDPSWLSAKDARRLAHGAGGINPALAGPALIDQCRLGLVEARAVLMQRADSGRRGEWTAEEGEWAIPEWFWQGFTGDGTSSQDWERGVFAGKGTAPAGRCLITLTGAYFLRSSVEAAFGLANTVDQSASPPTFKDKGGKPPAPYWDEMWCAIWARYMDGEWKPKTKGEIRKGMTDWLAEREHYPGDSTLKPKAALMFETIQRLDENLDRA